MRRICDRIIDSMLKSTRNKESEIEEEEKVEEKKFNKTSFATLAFQFKKNPLNTIAIAEEKS